MSDEKAKLPETIAIHIELGEGAECAVCRLESCEDMMATFVQAFVSGLMVRSLSGSGKDELRHTLVNMGFCDAHGPVMEHLALQTAQKLNQCECEACEAKRAAGEKAVLH